VRVTDLFSRIQNYLLGDEPAVSYYNDKILVGAKFIPTMEKSSPPLVVLVATSGKADTTPEYPGRNSNPRGMRSSDLNFDAYCWGKDYDSAELLEAAVLTACFQAVGAPRAYIDGEEWVTGATTTAGEILIAHFRVTGFIVPTVKLPLSNPIGLDVDTQVTLTGPITVSDPATPMSTDLSIRTSLP